MGSGGYKNILSPGELILPLNLERLSGGLPKAALEIGFGNGEYTAQWAASNPDFIVIGLEVSVSCVTRCARRSEGLPNLKIICADARFMMKELFADEALDLVVMNFPCPWPKTRHAKRRVAAGEFADGLASVLKVGGAFELATDEEWYAGEVERALSKHGALEVTGREVNASRPVTTKYERKWLEMGKPITRLTVAKTKKFTAGRQTWQFYRDSDWSEDGMHVKNGKPLPEGGLAFLTRVSGERGEARWTFKGHYSSGTGKHFLVETVTSDGEFEQRCYLKAVERGGDTMVKLDGTAKVFLTPAVRFAVEDLARRLAEAP